MIETRGVFDDAIKAFASGDVSESHRTAVAHAIGRISGYLDAWIRLDPRRAHRANIGAERILREMSEVITELRATSPSPTSDTPNGIGRLT